MKTQSIIWLSLIIFGFISCEKSENDINIDSIIDTCDSNKGKILFCTNAHTMNCVFEIDISIDGEKAGILNAGSHYSDNDCFCENSADIGLLVSLEKGDYTYSAKEIKCNAINTTGSWSGDFSIAGDSCTVIFLDVTKD